MQTYGYPFWPPNVVISMLILDYDHKTIVSETFSANFWRFKFRRLAGGELKGSKNK